MRPGTCAPRTTRIGFAQKNPNLVLPGRAPEIGSAALARWEARLALVDLPLDLTDPSPSLLSSAPAPSCPTWYVSTARVEAFALGFFADLTLADSADDVGHQCESRPSLLRELVRPPPSILENRTASCERSSLTTCGCLSQRVLFARSDRVKSVDFHPTEPHVIACVALFRSCRLPVRAPSYRSA